MRSRFTLGLCVTLGFRSVQNVGPRGTSRIQGIQVDWLPIYTPVAGKGFLAADESAGPWLRAGHAEAAKIPDAWHFQTHLSSTPGGEAHSGHLSHLSPSESDRFDSFDSFDSDKSIYKFKTYL